MSLSKIIIYGTVDDVINVVKTGANVNQIDEYGYAPLIEAAIVNNVDKARVLLKAGAKVDFSDVTGRTALHWAADNNNLAMCQLLLEHKANPNAYTTAGEPVLALPLLRKQEGLVQLLRQYKADLIFAQDFINTKLLAHRYELNGYVDIVDSAGAFVEINFEGFYLEFTLAIILDSLKIFSKSSLIKNTNDIHKLNRVCECLEAANELIKYQHYNIDIQKNKKSIDALLTNPLLVVPLSYKGHAITLIRYYNYLIRCDRGVFGRHNGTVIIYQMNQPNRFNKSLVKTLMYKPQSRFNVQEGLEQHLALEPIGKLPLDAQITGNCSWANVEAVIPAVLFLLFMEEDSDDNSNKCQKLAFEIYNKWLDWDRHNALLSCVKDFREAIPQRQASKAAILAAILFQRCNYLSDKDLNKERKIFPILSHPAFNYILENYADVFCRRHKFPRGKNLLNMFDDFGIDVDE